MNQPDAHIRGPKHLRADEKEAWVVDGNFLKEDLNGPMEPFGRSWRVMSGQHTQGVLFNWLAGAVLGALAVISVVVVVVPSEPGEPLVAEALVEIPADEGGETIIDLEMINQPILGPLSEDRAPSTMPSTTIETEPDPTVAADPPPTTIANTTSTAPKPTSTSAKPPATTAAPPAPTSTAAPAPTPSGNVVWRAGHEKGSLTSEWTYVVNIPGDASAVISSEQARSGSHSAKLTVNGPAKAGTRLKLARAPGYGVKGDKNESLPVDAYYSVWYYLPQHVTHEGWFWNVWQWEHSTVTSGGGHTATPLFVINIVNRGPDMVFLLSRALGTDNKPMANSVKAAESSKPIPIGRWFHLECRYKWSRSPDGVITCWQDGEQIFNVTGLVTDADIPFLFDKWEWTVNNYTQNTNPASHSLYVDDAALSLTRLGP